jgi:hypothetical protein
LTVQRPTVALVTGFSRNATLTAMSFAPLLQLRQEGAIRDIHYVTWDSPDLDALVAPVAALDGVAITRVPAPQNVTGGASQKSVLRQAANLKAALDLVASGNTLVVKTRPDFIFSPDFLRAKLAGFETLCAVDRGAAAYGVAMPDPPFARKIWLPWADANQPFFYEDGTLIGLKRDLALLVTQNVEARYAPLYDPDTCGSFGHVVRFAPLFLPHYPIFARYLLEYSAFANDVDYRTLLVPVLLEDPFFWHLLVAHGWILRSAFHVDCGEQNDLLFYPNTSNDPASWGDLRSLRLGNPYNAVTGWRSRARAGLDMLSALQRPFGRLVDDAWQRAMFEKNLPDVPASMIQELARNVTAYETGVLGELEDTFYAKLSRFHENNWLSASARVGLTIAPPQPGRPVHITK